MVEWLCRGLQILVRWFESSPGLQKSPSIKKYLDKIVDFVRFHAISNRVCYSPVAQSVEQVTVNHWVAGSSPARGANPPFDKGGVRAFVLQAGRVKNLSVPYVIFEVYHEQSR